MYSLRQKWDYCIDQVQLVPLKQTTTPKKNIMKKTIVLAAMLAGTLSAQAAFVASAESYGIINIPIEIGMNAIGINVLPMSAASNLVQNVIVGDELVSGESQDSAAAMYIFNGTGYNIYWLSNTGVTVTNWTNGGSAPTANPGTGMWIKSPTACTIYQMGLVPTNATINIACAPTSNTFIANPYPIALDFDGDGSKINWSGVAVGAKRLSAADLIRVWNGVGYDTYYYYYNAAAPASTGWYNASGDHAPLIKAGEGFWFFRRGGTGSVNVPVTNPFAQ